MRSDPSPWIRLERLEEGPGAESEWCRAWLMHMAEQKSPTGEVSTPDKIHINQICQIIFQCGPLFGGGAEILKPSELGARGDKTDRDPTYDERLDAGFRMMRGEPL